MTHFQQTLLSYLATETLEFRQIKAQREVHANLLRLGAAARLLYLELLRSGHEITFSEDLNRNCDAGPIDPKFFE